jgi:hypothetical protein
MKTGMLVTTTFVLALLIAGLSAMPAAVSLGGFAHVWGEYPSDGFGFLGRYSYTAGPLISFSAGPVVWDFWYGLDPIQNGWVGKQPDPIATGEVKVNLDELGWRLSLATPLFLSASYSRLHCLVTPVPCNVDYTAGGWIANQVMAGGGVRVGPFWALVEGGVRWWDWQGVAGDGKPVETGLYIASGFSIPTSSIRSDETRHSVESISKTFEEDFPPDCDKWNWTGQSGRISVIDEQLSIRVEEQRQRVMQRFGCDEGRFTLDVDVSPFSSYNSHHFFGVVLRYEDDDNFYVLDIRADGYVRFSKVLDGTMETMIPWTRTQAYNAGGTNHLRVIAPGNKFVLYLNDRRVLVVPEVSFVKGDIGVFAGTESEPGTWVSFDNIVIRAIPPNTLLDPRTENAKNYDQIEKIGLSLLGAVGSYISFSQGWDLAGYGFSAATLYELLSDTKHLMRVK